MHDDENFGASKKGMTNIFDYIKYRIESKLTVKNLTNVMMYRHDLYKTVYDLELAIHQGNEIRALNCLKSNRGAEIVDLKNKPSITTKASLLRFLISKNMFRNGFIFPLLKLFFFVFDLTKDIAFLIYLSFILFNNESDELKSNEDYFVFGIYATSLCYGQIVLSIFCFLHRYEAVSVCYHDGKRFRSALLHIIMVLFFPITGVLMATHKYLNEKYLENYFKTISDGYPTVIEQTSRFQSSTEIDWSAHIISKNEYGDIITMIIFLRKRQSMGGFEMVTMVENVTESYFQILVFLVLYNQPPYEGVLNSSLFALSREEANSFLGNTMTRLKVLLIVSSICSIGFVATGIVGYINVLQDNGMTIKEKFTLSLIYVIRVITSLATSTILLLLKSNRHPSFGYHCYLSILGVKILILLCYTFRRKSFNKMNFKTLLFLSCNFHIPISLDTFENLASNGELKIRSKFSLVWILSAVENLSRLFLLYALSNDEFFYKVIVIADMKSFTLLVIFMELTILALWHQFFHKLFLWKDLLKVSLIGTIHQNFTLNDKQSHIGIPIEMKIDESRNKEVEKNSGQVRRSNSVHLPQEFDVDQRRMNCIRRTHSIHKIELTLDNQDIDGKNPIILGLTDLGYKIKSIFNKEKNCDQNTWVNRKTLKDIFTCKKGSKAEVLGIAKVFSILSVFVIFVTCTSTSNLSPEKQMYKDCHEINIIENQKDGVYKLFIYGKPVYTFCRNGSALIQQRSASSGNSKTYFHRGFNAYKDGFGFTEKEFFLGLNNILALTKRQNTVLKIEVVTQDGSKMFFEFGNFTIAENLFDNVTYHMYSPDPVRKVKEQYPIINLGQQTSSVANRKLILIHPAYLKPLETKVMMRIQLKYYHDMLFAGFTTLDMETNYECSNKFRSGWWFPYGIQAHGYATASERTNDEKCQYDDQKPITNLNGVFDKNEDINQRQIVLCEKQVIEECFTTNYHDFGYNLFNPNENYRLISGWSYNNVSVIKLTDTKMWLKRP